MWLRAQLSQICKCTVPPLQTSITAKCLLLLRPYKYKLAERKSAVVFELTVSWCITSLGGNPVLWSVSSTVSMVTDQPKQMIKTINFQIFQNFLAIFFLIFFLQNDAKY